MVGATMVGALADLGNYPAPFVNSDGAFSGAIVIGANAATSDVLGAIDIAASLQAEAKTGTPIAGGEVAVVGGDTIDTYNLNDELSNTTLTQSDIPSLQDTTLRWNSKDIDVYDEIYIGENALSVATYTPVDGQDDAFTSDPYLVVDTEGKVMYKYVFDDAVNVSELAAHNLDINFLGKKLTISAIADGSMTVEGSNEFYMEEGDTVQVENHDIALKRVGSGSVLVTVDGQTLAVDNNGDTQTFDQADDFEVAVSSSFYIQDATDNSATLKMGSALTKSVSDGESLEMFGEPSDSDNAEWTWEISLAGTDIAAGDYIAAVETLVRTQATVTGADERPALAEGQPLEFPNKYASIEFVGYEGSAQTVYDDLKIKPVYTKFGADGYQHAMELSTTADSKSFYIDDNSVIVEKSTKAYVAENGNIYNGDKDLSLAAYNSSTDDITLKLDKEDVVINMTNGAWTITAGTDIFTLALDNSTGFLGFGTAATAEDTDVNFTDGASSALIGENDKTFRTTYGIIVKDMKSQMESDDFVISVPHEEQIPVIAVNGKDATVSTSESGMSYTVNPIALGLGVLDTDATLGSKPMIVVGGPVINTVAAELMGNPTPDQIAATFSQGKAIIKWYDDKQAMLVAGYEAMETQGAAYVVARHGDYDFTGNELEVVVTSLNDISVNTV